MANKRILVVYLFILFLYIAQFTHNLMNALIYVFSFLCHFYPQIKKYTDKHITTKANPSSILTIGASKKLAILW